MVSEPTRSGGPRSGGLEEPTSGGLEEPAVTNEDSEWWPTEWWPGKASRDQRGRWPLRGVECYGFGSIARYGTCPTLVVWATDEGFIDQMGSLT